MKLLGYKEPNSTVPNEFHFKNLQNGCFTPELCTSNEKLLIIIPYRDREDHLKVLLNNLHPFLQRQNRNYCVLVAEQATSNSKFNKGLLMNAAFTEFQEQFSCIVFHDVDMLPEDDRNLYKCNESPTHLSTKISKFKYKYPYGTDFGGVTMLKSEQYLQLNGHSNLFWGWGREDNDIEWRIRQRGFEIQKPDPIDYGRYTMISHTHDLGFQSEKKLKNSEDSISSQVHSILMKDTKFLRINVDGLSSVVGNYKISSFSQRNSFSKILLDIDRIKNFKAKFQVLGQSKFLNLENRTNCHFIKLENSNLDRSYVQNEGTNVKLYHKNINFDICGQGCLGIGSKWTENGPLYFPVKAPVLKKTPGQYCWLKECENDSSGFQFMEIFTNETDIKLQGVSTKIWSSRFSVSELTRVLKIFIMII